MPRTITLVVPEEIVAKAKVKAVTEDVSLSAVVRSWFTLWADGDIETPEAAKEEGKAVPVQVATAGINA